MFERLTDGARKAVALGHKAARTLGHDFIGTEHILLGLLDGENEATVALTRLRVDLAALRRAVEESAPPGPPPGHAVPGGGTIPFTPRAKRALEEAMRMRGVLDDHNIGCAHLLLGLLAEGEGVAARALGKLVSFEEFREAALAVQDSVESIEKPIRTSRSIEMAALDWAKQCGERTLAWAGKVALELGHDFIDREHVLLGILDAGDSTAVRALARLGIEPAAVRAEIERRRAPRSTRRFPPAFCLRLNRVLYLSRKEARDEGRSFGTEHILLGLLAEGQGIAAQALTALGLDLDGLRAAVAAEEAIRRTGSPATPPPSSS